MLHSNIQNRFHSEPKKTEFQNISAIEWNDWKWQVQNSKSFVTPYYLNLSIGKMIEAQKYLYDVSNNLLASNDKEILSHLNETIEGITEIFLPMISVLPQRITEELIDQLKKKDQVIIHFSINHPKECTLELVEACTKLADSGFILNNHMTLLKGVNDTAELVKELNLKLLMMRVRPYSIYLYETRADESPFFTVTRESAVEILESLRGWTSGLAVPHMLAQKTDKTFEALLPNYVKKNEGENFIFRNYKHMDYEYSNS